MLSLPGNYIGDAVASSTDMLDWNLKQPLAVDVMTEETEVPQVNLIEAHYYLPFATFLRVILPEFRDRHSMAGPSPRGPFSIHRTGDVHPREPNPYACQLVQFGGEWFLLGTPLLVNQFVDHVVRHSGKEIDDNPEPHGEELADDEAYEKRFAFLVER